MQEIPEVDWPMFATDLHKLNPQLAPAILHGRKISHPAGGHPTEQASL